MAAEESTTTGAITEEKPPTETQDTEQPPQQSDDLAAIRAELPSVQDVSQDTLRQIDSEAEGDTPKRTRPTAVETGSVSQEKKERLSTPTGYDGRECVYRLDLPLIFLWLNCAVVSLGQCHYKGKLVILGDISVGKTAIVTRCESNSFRRDQKTTIGKRLAAAMAHEDIRF